MSIQQIMQTFHISKRTVYYDMDKINHWLKSHQLEPVQYVRETGFLLPPTSRKKLPTTVRQVHPAQYHLSRKERSAWLAIYLLTCTAPVYLYHLEELLNVSRGTAHKELKALGLEITEHGLELEFSRKKGYSIQGSEADKRKALAYYLSQVIAQVSWKDFVTPLQGLINAALSQKKLPLLQEDHLSLVYDIIVSGEQLSGMELTDEAVHHLASRLMLFTNRLLNGQSVSMDEDEKQALRETPVYPVAEQIAKELGRLFSVTFPEDEVCYITMHLLGARVNRMAESNTDQEAEKIERATVRMIDQFERLGCVFFHHREQLEKQLYQHVKPAYYRIKYGLHVDNPLADTVKSKYSEVFDLTKRAAEPLQELLNNRINDEEIAYLSMHFGGWLRREEVSPVARQKAAIVCVNGISASRMLKIQLEQLFPSLDWIAILSLRDYEKFEEQVDWIFSTVPLAERDVPVFVVSPILTEEQKTTLLQQVQQSPAAHGGSLITYGSVQNLLKVIGQHATIKDEKALTEDLTRYLGRAKPVIPPATDSPNLSALLNGDTIQIKNQVKDWEEAIRLASQPLIGRGAITARYVEAMIAKVKERGPYIVVAPGIAIAHAKPEDGVNATSLALLKLNRPVAFGPEEKHQVLVLFVLASRDGQSHLAPLSQLTVLLRDGNKRSILEETNDIQTIRNLLQDSDT